MILDRIENRSLYPFGTAWKAAFDFLKTLTPDSTDGKHLVQGNELTVAINTYTTKARAAAKLETHRKYVDIQLLLSGSEVIEVFPKAGLTVSEPYIPERDVEFYQVPAGAPARMTLVPGEFLVFFPDDAHMPCVMAGNSPEPVKKVVVKIAVELLTQK
ncbi:MAG TPA: YhcH/YjgK/YiaL family protein [Pontiellaceae bacterium]|nr:YhcH/YjgK/YiaL family protein [Pontiellaceae bacterium]